MSSIKDRAGLLKELVYAGYSEIREPYDISSLSTPDTVVDCEAIAQKHFFKIWYLDVKSNWKRISQEVAKKSEHPCLVITSFENHTILATVKNHNTIDAKPRYVVIDNSKPQLYSDFIKSIKVESNDNFLDAYNKVQDAFDKFSKYSQAIDEFGANLEDVISATRNTLEKAMKGNKKYETESVKFLEMCKSVISNRIEIVDIKEMLIQHILTYEIFSLIYDSQEFHNTNTVAKSLEKLTGILGIKIDNMHIDYTQIKLVAETLDDANDRQEFLHGVYETFYAKYNPARANKDGIVYTPSEVVNFMVKSTNELMEKHFEKCLSDDNITILDPATGTGTFIASVLRHLKPDSIKEKYKNDLFANEISILPYYIAALNIENTYRELGGKSIEFENVCWMDTLDSGMKDYEKLTAYFDGNDNIKRMSRQQKANICVVIGNPPYNATQRSANDANPSDAYPHIDKMIQEDYSKYGTAQNKGKSIDMYKRFLKWSSERIKEKGMVVFVSNNSFLDAKVDDGLRKALYDEFDYIYTVNLKGNARLAGDGWKREGGKIFGGKARVGVVISFFIKTGENKSKIQYAEVDDYLKREDKLKWLEQHTVATLNFEEIIPNKDAVWLNQTDSDFETLIPILPRETKESIFEIVTPGVSTGKDDWTYDIDKSNLKKKIKYYCLAYNDILEKFKEDHTNITDTIKWVNKKIKWSDRTIQCLESKRNVTYSDDKIYPTLYRPFVIKYQYYDKSITERPRKFIDIFKNSQKNNLILFPNPSTNVVFCTVGIDMIIDNNSLMGGAQNIPLWQYDSEGKKHNNVTKYGLELFQKHYKNTRITNEDIFYYVYGMFNDIKYEKVYRHDLRRKLPHVPLAKNFAKYSEIGKELFDLHCNFDTVKEYGLKRTDKITRKNKILLRIKKEKEDIKIFIDDETVLSGVPKEVFEYKLGPRNSIHWILEFYKESKHQISEKSSDDEEVRKKFTTYKFADHKEDLIVLLNKVTTVCVETMKFRKKLEVMEWGPQPKLEFTKIEKTDKKNPKNTSKVKKTKKSSKKKNKEIAKTTKLDNFTN